jgi:hypothetical protein
MNTAFRTKHILADIREGKADSNERWGLISGPAERIYRFIYSTSVPARPCLRCSLRSNPAIVLTEDPFRIALFHKVQYGRFMFDEIRPSAVRTP